jgi:hypothetical protein
MFNNLTCPSGKYIELFSWKWESTVLITQLCVDIQYINLFEEL